ncbi:MAG: sulfatase-like hydrolase/transferase [Planctomycetaceae bacterium]
MWGRAVFPRSSRIFIGVIFAIVAVTAITVFWPRPPRPSIILVTFDTTRADRLGCYGYPHGLTSAFDEFAKGGVLFERAFAPCPITLPSHATMLTGLYPPEHDLRVNGSGHLSSEIPFLPAILKEHGYDTGAFIAAAPVLGAQFGLSRGFDTYDDAPARLSTRVRPYGGERRDGEEVVTLALDWLQQRTDKPYFCWIHLYDAHGPYDAFADIYQQKFEKEPYDAGVAWEIRQLARVTALLKERGLDSNTLVIVAGDHGEGLNDHGEHEHSMLVYNSTLHVPLVFAGLPECQPGTRVKHAVSLADLMPTVLDILNIKRPDHVSGRSLLAALNGQPIESRDCYAESEMPYFLNRWCPLQTVISEQWKYIESTRPELYNLELDPHETTNLIDTATDERSFMEIKLSELTETFQKTRAEHVELSERDQANLQSLGYVSGGTSAHTDPSVGNRQALIDVKDMVPFIAKFEDAKHIASGERLEEAIALLQEVASGTKDFPLSDARLGDLLAESGRTSEALEVYSSVLERRPDFASVHVKSGRILASLGQFAPAETHFREAVRLTPHDASVHLQLANVLTQEQRFDEAIAEYREALRIAPHAVAANLSLGNLLVKLRRPTEAIACFENAQRYDANNFAVLENLMMVLAQTGQIDKAVTVGSRAIALNPASFESQFNLGIMLVQASRIADGLKHLREAQKLRPSDPRPAQIIQEAELALKGSSR